MEKIVRSRRSILAFALTLVLYAGISINTSAVNKYSVATGNWNSTSTWSLTSGGAPGAPVPVLSDAVIIEGGYTVTVNTSTAVLLSLTISSGSTLSVSANNTVRSNTITVNGTYTNNSTGTLTVTNLTVNGTWNHNTSSANLPIGSSSTTWASNSNLNITGSYSSATVLNNFVGQTFGNFTFNPGSMTNSVALIGAAGTTTIAGNFTITSTGSSTLYMRIYGQAFSGIININGNFTMSSGIFDLHNGGNTATNESINLKGNFSLSATSVLTQTTTLAGSTANVNFTGTTTQAVTIAPGAQITSQSTTSSCAIQFNVASGSTIDMGTSVFPGTNNTGFSVSTGATIITANQGGLSSSGATGSIQVSGARTFSSGANYTYNGSSSQVTGTGLPSTVNNLTINNSAGVTLTSAEIINGTLSIGTNGELNTGAFISYATNLTLNGATQGAGTYGSTSSPAANKNDTYFAGTGYVSAGAIPPANLSYPSPNTYTTNVAITPLNPTVTGTVTGYSVNPALPAGLSLNTTTGIISGTPTLSTATGTYTVTATNIGGSTTFGLVISVGSSITSAQTGNWSLTTTWTGGVVPGPGDNVTIVANHIVTVDITTAVCSNLNIAPVNNNISTLTFNSGQKLTVYGIVTLGNSVNTNRRGAINMTNGGTLTCKGLAIANAGANTFTPGTGTVELTAINTLPATIFTSFNNLTISGGSTTSASNLTIGGNLGISTGASFATGPNFTLGVIGNSAITGNLTLGGTGAKTFTGDITINPGGVWNETGIAPINYAGSLTNNGSTFNALSGTHTFSGATKTISGTGAISIATATFTGNYTNSATFTVPTLLTVTGVTLTNNGNITATTALSGTGTLAQGTTGVLNLGGTYGITTLTATATGNTVNYTGAAQTVRAINYYHLTLSGSGTKTLQTGTTSIGGNLTLSGTAAVSGVVGMTVGGNVDIGTGTTFTAGNFTHNVGGNWIKNGTFTAGTSTINFNGSGIQEVGAGNFNNLNFSGSGPISATGALIITGNVTIATNFSGGSFSHNLQGNWTNNGTFAGNTSTVVFNGATTQTIAGSASTIFNGLTVNGPGLTLGVATSVAGTLNLTSGKLDIGNYNLTLTSTGSVSGGSSTSYVRTSGTGRMKQAVPGVGGSRVYPVGNSAYNPMTVQYNDINTSENFSIRVEDGIISNANSTKTVNRKWYLIEDAAGTSNLTLTSTYNTGEEGSGFNNATNPQIGYFDGTSWAFRPITSGSGTTTFVATGSAPDFTNASGFFVLGSDDAFNATKLAVTNINPANPSIGAASAVITVQALNSNNIPAMVTTATGFSLSATNTVMSPASPTGTIAQYTYQTTVPSIAFTTTTFNGSTYNHNATVTATQTSGDALSAGTSSAFDVLIGAIYEPVASENWDAANGWRKSTDGGSTWTNPASLPVSNIFGETDLIRIPSGITLTANATASFYSMLVYGTLDISSSGSLTLNHSTNDIDYNITVSGTLKNSGGTLTNSNSAYPLKFQGGTYWHNMNGGSIPVSTWSTLGSTASTCNVTAITSTALTAGLDQTFQNFTWNNTSQSVTQNLGGDMTVTGALTLTAGAITTGSYHVIVGLNGTASNSGAGYINGTLRRYVATNVTTGEFPVGDATNYAPFAITVTGTPSGDGYLEVSTKAMQPPAASGLSQTKYINRRWTLSNNGVAGVMTYSPSFTFTNGDAIGSPVTANLRLRKLTLSTWYTTNGAATGNTISATGLATTGLTATSYFYAAEENCSATTAVWLGSTSTDWNTATNWCSGLIPAATTNVTIPSSPPRQPVIGSANATCNNITVETGAILTVSGSDTLFIKGNWYNSGTFTSLTGTVSFSGSAPQTISGATTFNNLLINNTTGVTAGNDITVNGTLSLTSANPDPTHGTLDMATYTLSMLEASANVTGTGDVTGRVKRRHTFTPNTPYQFGNQYTTLNFMNLGTQPDEITTKIAIGSAPTWKSDALSRFYSFELTGSTATDRVVANLGYLDSELNSNNSSKLVLWDHHSDGTTEEHGKTSNSTTNHWVGLSGLSISYLTRTDKLWALANSAAVKNTWTGAHSTDWSDIANWTAGHVPYATDDVLIPDVSSVSNQFPVLTSNVEIRTLEIASGASLTANAFDMTINGSIGAWQNNGVFDPGTGTIYLTHGIINQIVSVSGTTQFNNITIAANTFVRPVGETTIKIAGLVSGDLTCVVDLSSYGNTVEYNGVNQYIVNPSTIGFAEKGYYNLIIGGSGTKTLVPGDQLDIAGDFTSNASFDISLATVSFIGTTAQNISGSVTPLFKNLTINNSAGVTSSLDLNVNGVLNLQSANPSATSGSLDMGSKSLTMGAEATTSGAGDVTGIVTRNSFAVNTPYSFGNEYTTLTMASGGTLPTSVSFKIVLSDSYDWLTTNMIKRYYDIKQTGGNSATMTTLNLHYLDDELNGATETNLHLFDHDLNPVNTEDQGASNFNSTENWVGMSNLDLSYVAQSDFDIKYWTIGASTSGNNCTWTGKSSTAWSNAANWSGGIPGVSSNVIIPDAAFSYNRSPELPDGVTIVSMFIQQGGVLNAASGSVTLTITGATGAWNNLGTFNPATSTVVFTNPEATLADPTTFYNVTIASDATLTLETDNSMSIAGVLTNNGILYAALNHNTIEYNGNDQTIINPNGTTPGYHNLVFNGSGTKTLPSQTLSILGDFSLSGSVSAVPSYPVAVSGNLNISGTSHLTLGASEILSDDGPVILNGGYFSTGVTTGYSETAGTLKITDNSTIVLGTGSNSLRFAKSNDLSWTSGKILTITGWQGGYDGSTGTEGKLFVGNSVSGLTSGQLAQILFYNLSNTTYYISTILATGEIVPSVPQDPWTWTGTTSSDWNVATNWASPLGGVVPPPGANVVVADVTADPVVSTAVRCNNLTINSGGVLTITSTGQIAVNGNLTVEGSNGLIINSDASSNGSLIVSGSSSGEVTYNRYMVGDRWYIISSPVNISQSIGQWLSDTQVPKDVPTKVVDSETVYGMAPYDEQLNLWNSYYTASTPDRFTHAKGYLLRKTSDGTIPFTGTLNTSPTSFNILRDNDAGWNSVGNPFTSSIGITASASSAKNFLTENLNKLDPNYAAIYVYTNPGYSVINNSPLGSGYYGGSHLSDNYVQVGQGFLVKSVNGGAVLDFTREMCTAQPSQAFRSVVVSNWSTLILNAVSGGQTRSTSIGFRSDMTNGLDPTYDAGIFKSDPNFEIYTRLVEDNGLDFAVQCLPSDAWNTLSIPLGIDFPNGGEVVFSLGSIDIPVGYYPIITDKLLNTSTYLKTSADKYSVILPAGTAGAGRFIITFGEGGTTSIEEQLTDKVNSIKVYPNPATDLINAEIEGYKGRLTIQIINIRGSFVKEIRNEIPDKGRQKIEIPVNSFSQGLYIFNAIFDDGTRKTIRVIVGK